MTGPTAHVQIMLPFKDEKNAEYLNKKPLNSRKGQRTNQKYRNLVGSDQQI